MNKVNEADENWQEISIILQRKYKKLEEDLVRWKDYQKGYEKLRLFLIDLPKTTRRSYFVPFSQKAYIPGYLVHTNEILVLFGENWFVERSSVQAIDIVDRRLKYVKENLEVLNKKSKDVKSRLDHAIKMTRGRIYNEEGLKMVEIREELNEDGSIARNAEVLDCLAEPWVVDISNELSKKFESFLETSNENYEVSDIEKNLKEIFSNTTISPESQDFNEVLLPMNVPDYENMETMINITNEIDEMEADANTEYSYDDSDDSETSEDQYGRTRGFISPVCIPDVSSKVPGHVKKVTFSDSIESIEEEPFNTENAHSFKESKTKDSTFLIKDVVERSSTESTEQVLDKLELSLHRKEIAAEYYRLKQKLHAQNENFDHNDSKQEYIENNNYLKKKVSRFKASFMERKGVLFSLEDKMFQENQMTRRFQEKQAMRQRGAVKHKVQNVPFEILPISSHLSKLSHVDTERNENRPSSLIKYSGKRDDQPVSRVHSPLALSPSVSALRALNKSFQKKKSQHDNEIHKVSYLESKDTHHKSSVSSYARRTGSPASKPPPRISVGSTPLKEQFLNDNIKSPSVRRSSENIDLYLDAKRLKKASVDVQNEKIMKRQKTHKSPMRDHWDEKNSDKEEYTDTDDEDHDYGYDETKVPITVHKFPERGVGSINEIDVVSQVILVLLKHLRKKTESAYAKKVIHAFEEEVAVKFLEMTDILDNCLVLDRAVRKSAREVAHLRNELFIIRKARSDVAVKIRHLRQRHNDANNESQALKSIQNFLEDIELLHNKITPNRQYTEKTGIVSLLQTSTLSMTETWGVLERLTAFNAFLKKIDEALD
ncbi:hypothetical protein PORY_000115 [Pneumocystis oryctolagi]|uniref:Uncharacterized protein n=1 Tax=Pneumocystis oryctolagi TaxID=42067 RepID=A0ACB7CG69_9ASCO|nr:hypothetical protein PORY_000115 [Pneumocystis oryctolagi]